MSYLSDYNEYVEYGGKRVSAADFPLAEKKAALELDYITRERMKNIDPIPDGVKLCMVEVMDTIAAELESEGKGLSSYSNGTESFAFDNSMSFMDKLITIATRLLPPEYTYRGVKI